MSDFFLNTLTGWQWGIVAIIPPAIIALYFLKLKRQPLEVPSTYLWKKSIEDLHVNSLWQRMRQNLLMFLQLLLVALAILALLRPGWQGTKLEGQRFIFLIDNSASMSATDVDDAADRLEEAKRSAEALIDQMDAGMTAMIISFADTPQVVQEFTDNRRLLRERLETIKPTPRATDLKGALELASGLANPGRVATTDSEGRDYEVAAPQPATTYIFSDGRFEDVKGFSLGNLQPVYVPVGSFEAANLAITAFATRRNETRPEEQQAFVQVSNFTNEPHKATVELQHDGQFMDAKEIDVPAGESAGTVFPLTHAPAGALSARLKYELSGATKDALAQDDKAFAPLNETATGKVLVVTPGNVALQTALGTSRAARLDAVKFLAPADLDSAEYRADIESGTYDLVIYDQCVPPQLPRANTVFIGRLPPGPIWRGESKSGGSPDAQPQPPDDAAKRTVAPQIIDWDRSHPLLAHVELGNVDVADSLVLTPPPGATVLIESTAGPIAAIAPRDAYQDAVLGFEIVGQEADGTRNVNTNWPRRLSFPTFWLNTLEYLAGRSEETEATTVRPGRPIELRAPTNADKLTVRGPDGETTTVPRNEQDVFQYSGTDLPGVYEVRNGDKVIERFAVNLFDRAESDVRVRPSQDPENQTVRAADIRIGHVDVAAASGQTPARRELWRPLLLGALFVLLVEWYIYNRRVYL